VSTNTIEREIEIAAPIERVWSLITQPEHLGTWFGDAGADIDLRPGGALEVRSQSHTVTGQVAVVEPTSRFAFRWAQLDTPAEVELEDGNSTLVEFSLFSAGDRTRVRVVESGFDLLALPDENRAGLLKGHTEGWDIEVVELQTYAGSVAA
jgi:uncharacterized protein YndB with AHSA1/START domain